VNLRMISGAPAAITGHQFVQLVAAQGVAATAVDHMPEES
jgi:hypothetical protein